MAFEQFPYTNFHDLNLDWILKEVKRVSEAVDKWSTEVLDAAKAYADAKVAAEAERANQANLELKQSVETAIRDFQNVVNGTLTGFQEQLKQQDAEIDANLVAARGYTNAQIAQNNEFLMEEISKGLIDLKVLNLFTGKYVTVQEMFDYLSAFHLTGAISIAQVANAQRTVTTVVGYKATCTDIVKDGYKIFYP
nr:MAG TPA: hypothetical protein [Caudoviricetes sp.]